MSEPVPGHGMARFLSEMLPAETFSNLKRKGSCANCGASQQHVRLSLCSGCMRAYYCSKHCQKVSWGRQHKHECVSIQAQVATLVARYRTCRGSDEERPADSSGDGEPIVRTPITQDIAQMALELADYELEAADFLIVALKSGAFFDMCNDSAFAHILASVFGIKTKMLRSPMLSHLKQAVCVSDHEAQCARISSIGDLQAELQILSEQNENMKKSLEEVRANEHDLLSQIQVLNSDLQSERNQRESLNGIVENMSSVGLQFQTELEVWRHDQSLPCELRPRPHLVRLVRDVLRMSVPQHHCGDCARLRSVEVTEVREVFNLRLWNQYKLWRKHMADNLSDRYDCPWASDVIPPVKALCKAFQYMWLDNRANEVILFHGTSEESALAIAQHGFDERLCKRDFYGRGIYMTSDACKAIQYAGQECTTLIVARVCMGHPFVASGPRMREDRPPAVEGLQVPYDTIVAKPGTSKGKGKGPQVHWEVVVPARGDSQIYPEMLVRFS